MEAAVSSGMSFTIYQNKTPYSLANHNLNCYCCKNFKLYRARIMVVTDRNKL
jgi:hypothetical protein